jgi:hypothetical protein
MAILNFPATPSNGDIYEASNGIRYQYDATYQYWKFVSASANGDIVISGRLLRTDGAEYTAVMNANPKLDNYTLILSDAGRLVSMNATTDKTITIPANASVSFPRGSRIDFLRLGTGEVTITLTTDKIRAPNSSFRLTYQNSAATVVKTDWTEWTLAGDLKV